MDELDTAIVFATRASTAANHAVSTSAIGSPGVNSGAAAFRFDPPAGCCSAISLI